MGFVKVSIKIVEDNYIALTGRKKDARSCGVAGVTEDSRDVRSAATGILSKGLAETREITHPLSFTNLSRSCSNALSPPELWV